MGPGGHHLLEGHKVCRKICTQSHLFFMTSHSVRVRSPYVNKWLYISTLNKHQNHTCKYSHCGSEVDHIGTPQAWQSAYREGRHPHHAAVNDVIHRNLKQPTFHLSVSPQVSTGQMKGELVNWWALLHIMDMQKVFVAIPANTSSYTTHYNNLESPQLSMKPVHHFNSSLLQLCKFVLLALKLYLVYMSAFPYDSKFGQLPLRI